MTPLLNERADTVGPSWTDTGFVLLSGPAPWWGSEEGALAERLAAYSMLAWAFLTATTMLTINPDAWGENLLVIAGMAVFWLPPLEWARSGHWIFGRRPLLLIPLRTGAAMACAIGFVLSDVPLILAATLSGMVGGADANLSLRGIGVHLRWRHAIVRFATSAIHLGVLVGLAVATLAFDLPVVDGALRYYVLMWFTIGVILVSVVWFQAVEQMSLAERGTFEANIKAEQHRSRAHWIHDDVCSELRYMRMQLEQRTMDGDELLHALADLDHRLRLRQLDEHVDSGSVRIAEVVQPFVRTLQDRGVDVLDVPPYDIANTPLSPTSARMLRHALGVLVPNAIQAGAHSVSIRCRIADGRLAVEVEDDGGGGFTMEDIPAGRALDGLRHELSPIDGAPPIEVEPTADGSVVRVRVPIGAGS